MKKLILSLIIIIITLNINADEPCIVGFTFNDYLPYGTPIELAWLWPQGCDGKPCSVTPECWTGTCMLSSTTNCYNPDGAILIVTPPTPRYVDTYIGSAVLVCNPGPATNYTYTVMSLYLPAGWCGMQVSWHGDCKITNGTNSQCQITECITRITCPPPGS